MRMPRKFVSLQVLIGPADSTYQSCRLAYALANDGTAWESYRICGEWEEWNQIRNLPEYELEMG